MMPLAAAEPSAGATPSDSDPVVDRIRELKLEEILNSEVTSVLGKSDTILTSPSAVSVLTADDLRRSGVRHLPDALRLVPGISVVQTDAWSWGVDAREMSKRKYARGLQVLVDGRSIYSPAWAAPFWDQADVLFEDVERIEVIRGPGGVTWGANASKGVINIITKEASKTEGIYASAGGGSVDRAFGEFRYGAGWGEHGALRVYGKAKDIAESPSGGDGWNSVQGGARADWRWADDQHLQVQGDVSWGERDTQRIYPRFGVAPTNSVVLDSFEVAGANGLARYTKQLGEASELSLLTYVDHVSRRGAAPDDLSENKYHVEARHRLPLFWEQDFQYGVGYQYFPSTVANRGDAALRFEPQTRRFQLFNVFVQDELQFFDDRLRLIGGARFEYHEPTGWDPLPSLRLTWQAVPEHVWWAAVSRAVTIPDRTQIDVQVNPTAGGPIYDPAMPGVPIFFRGLGEPDTGVESRIAYELGYRWQASESLSFDVTGFYNDQDHLVTGSVDFSQAQFVNDPLPHLEVPLQAVNSASGESYGVEWVANYRPAPEWNLSAMYTFNRIGSDDPLMITEEGMQAEHTGSLRVSWNPIPELDLDVWGRYVSDRPSVGVSDYLTADLRAAYHWGKRWELAVVGRNLVESERFESAVPLFFQTAVMPVRRSVYVQLSFRY
jgi:iron complex outermembrane receptor protein